MITIGEEKVHRISNDCIQKWLVQIHSIRKIRPVKNIFDIRSFCVPASKNS